MNSRAANTRSREDRDAGLRRIKKLTRWSLVGALAGTGVFAGLAAHAGGTTTSTATKATGQSTAASAGSKSTTSSASIGTAATTPTTATPVTVAPSSGSATIVSGAS